jgi:superfamily II RNA helicase
LLKDSYWFEQRRSIVVAVSKELAALELEYAAQRSTLSDAEYADLAERYRLEAAHKVAQNAAKKETQRLLDSWKNKHMGPVWLAGYKLLPVLDRLQKTIEVKKADLRSLESVDSVVEPRVSFLTAAGFLVAGPVELADITSANLTLTGVLATEVNESHSLLTAAIYAQGLMADLSGEEILTVLSAFINEKFADDAPTLPNMDVPASVSDMLYSVDDMARKFQEQEASFGIPYDNYWSLSLGCVEPVWRWLNGASSAQICVDYGIYEGNLMRVILRVANIADEWINLATYCEHTAMVEKMTAVKAGLLRDIAITDSLYLRI